jgi:hypothetical protein
MSGEVCVEGQAEVEGSAEVPGSDGGGGSKAKAGLEKSVSERYSDFKQSLWPSRQQQQ